MQSKFYPELVDNHPSKTRQQPQRSLTHSGTVSLVTPASVDCPSDVLPKTIVSGRNLVSTLANGRGKLSCVFIALGKKCAPPFKYLETQADGVQICGGCYSGGYHCRRNPGATWQTSNAECQPVTRSSAEWPRATRWNTFPAMAQEQETRAMAQK